MRISDFSNAGTLTLINMGRTHADKLAAHPNAAIKARALSVRGHVEDLQLAFNARAPLRALWQSATARKDQADDELDAAVSTLSYDLLAPGLLNKNRNAPEYLALFPQGDIRFLVGADREELAMVSSMVAHLKSNPAHPMSSRAGALDAKAAALDATLGPQAAAEQAYRSTQKVEADKRAALVRVLKKSITFLRDQLDADEKQVDALFMSLAEARVPDDVPPTE